MVNLCPRCTCLELKKEIICDKKERKIMNAIKKLSRDINFYKNRIKCKGLSPREIYEKIKIGEIRGDVTYKGKELNFEDVKGKICYINPFGNCGGLCIGSPGNRSDLLNQFVPEQIGDNELQIHSITIEPDLRFQGYGKAMMYMFLVYAQMTDVKSISVINHCIIPDYYKRFKWNNKEIIET